MSIDEQCDIALFNLASFMERHSPSSLEKIARKTGNPIRDYVPARFADRKTIGEARAVCQTAILAALEAYSDRAFDDTDAVITQIAVAAAELATTLKQPVRTRDESSRAFYAFEDFLQDCQEPFHIAAFDTDSPLWEFVEGIIVQ